MEELQQQRLVALVEHPVLAIARPSRRTVTVPRLVRLIHYDPGDQEPEALMRAAKRLFNIYSLIKIEV